MRTREVIRDAKSLVNWEELASDLESSLELAREELANWEEEGYLETANGAVYFDEFDDSTLIASEFLGTVFSLTPSGKYYLPFACSNVESCPRCKGTGQTANGKHCTWCDGIGSREAYLDEVWQDTVDAQAEKHGIFVFSGEGDPCDIFAGMSLDIG